MRRTVRYLAAAIVSLGLAFLQSGLSAQTESPLRIVTTPIEDAAGVYYAEAGGFFAQQGLHVQITSMNNGEAAGAALQGGSADISIGNLFSVAIAHRKGIDLRYLAPACEYIEKAPTTVLVVARDSKIRDAKDLQGKVIAVQSISDVKSLAAKVWLEQNGVDPATVKFIELRGPEVGNTLQRNIVDAGMLSEPYLSAALSQKTVRVIASPYSAIAKRFLINGWYAQGAWIDQHPAEAKKFAAAVVAGQSWAMKHPLASGKVLLNITKIDPTLLRALTRSTYADRFEPSMMQPVIDLAARFKVIDRSFPAEELYTKAK